MHAEQADQERLENRSKPPLRPKNPTNTGAAEPNSAANAKTDLDQPALDVQDDPVVLDHVDDAIVDEDAVPEPLSADDGTDSEDTSFLYPQGNESHEPDANVEGVPLETTDDHVPEAGMDEDHLDSPMADMLVLMDTLQTLGVDPVQANRFAASIVRA